MYDIDRPKFVFVSLLEEFIRETEHSLAYFFAVLVFLLTFLLALFGREALYTGLIGVFCLLLIKMRDIIEAFKSTLSYTSTRNDKETYRYDYIEKKAKRSFEDMQNFYTAFDDAAVTMMAKEFPARFNEQKQTTAEKKTDLLSYLETCRKIIETIGIFFPDQPLQPETQKALKKMTNAAQTYLLHYLEKKYPLTTEQTQSLQKSALNPKIDNFLFQTQMESFGIDEKTASWSVKIFKIINKIRSYTDFYKPEANPEDFSSPDDEKTVS